MEDKLRWKTNFGGRQGELIHYNLGVGRERIIGPIVQHSFCKRNKTNEAKKIKNDDRNNKDEPTACTHSAPHSAVWHFFRYNSFTYTLKV